MILTAVSPLYVPADGGHLLIVEGTFVLGRAHRVHVGSTAIDPQCWAGRAGRAFDVYPLSTGLIQCYTPQISEGLYDVFVRLADDSDSATLGSALYVRPASFHLATYALRRVLPPVWATGPRDLEQEEAL